jgi:hypothetical protein
MCLALLLQRIATQTVLCLLKSFTGEDVGQMAGGFCSAFFIVWAFCPARGGFNLPDRNNVND